ncbi:MAG: glycoside hydrolase family 3 C-terminal domain-containing protein [Bacteroidota bacterium]
MGKYIILLLLIGMACTSKQPTDEKTDIVTQDYEFPFLNPNLETDDRVKDLIARMTIAEKVLQLFNEAPAIERLHVPAYNWWNESLHGVARAGKATVFPQAIGLAATFNDSLMHTIATAISDEGRAKHHYFQSNDVRSIYTGLTFWSPNINIFRDPRWGRGQETYGEDPYLTGRMAVNFIKGLQGDDPKYFKTVATAKHYGVHSGPEVTRHTDNYFVNDRDLYETYLPAFKAAVQEANVQSIMCAYNRFRDQPCCGSNLLLDQILREELGFDGYVVSDCGAITDFYKEDHHNVVERPSQAWGWAIAAGTDLNCEENKEFIEDNIQQALETGMLNEGDINKALKRLFKARFKLGMFDPQELVPFTEIPMEVVGSEAHQKLALDAAKQSLVLLKNDSTLPLSKDTKVALIGPNTDNIDVLVGNYNGNPINPTTPLKAFQDRLGKAQVNYAAGTPLVPGFYGNMTTIPASVLFHEEGGVLKQGLKAKYFKDVEMAGNPDLERIDSAIDFIWQETPISKKVEETFAVEWTGLLKPETSGAYQFRLASLYGNAAIYVNGKATEDGFWELTAGKTYPLRITYIIKPFWWGNTVTPDAQLTWVNLDLPYETEALAAAEAADVILFCGGISPRLEGEEMKLDIDGFAHGDRTHLNLPANQLEILKKLKATGKPVIFINFSGSAMALNWENENLNAIVQAFYPGERTGEALAQLIFGDYSPSGRLPVTFYKSLEGLPAFDDYTMKNRTYKFFEGDVLYPFGYGLGYIPFDYQITATSEEINAGTPYEVQVTVTNNSDKSGNAVVQLYLTDKEADVRVPKKALVSFQTVYVEANTSKEVSYTINPDQMALINANYQSEVQEGEFVLQVMGSTGQEETTKKQSFFVKGNLVLQNNGADQL